VGDNEEVYGLRIIAPPGQTPGYICVLDPAGSLLILGDAMVYINRSATESVTGAAFMRFGADGDAPRWPSGL